MLHKRIKTLGDKYNNKRDKNKYSKEKLKQYMKWEDKIAMKDDLDDDSDSFVRLAIYLYTYFPPRRLDDYEMSYSNKPSKEMKNEDKTKNYIKSDCKFIVNQYKTGTPYQQQIFNCPIEIYQQIEKNWI